MQKDEKAIAEAQQLWVEAQGPEKLPHSLKHQPNWYYVYLFINTSEQAETPYELALQARYIGEGDYLRFVRHPKFAKDKQESGVAVGIRIHSNLSACQLFS